MNTDIRCPACRAVIKAVTCSRCGADLGDMITISSRAQQLSEEARQCFLAGDLNAAAVLSKTALDLHGSEEALSIHVLTLLAQQRRAEALAVWLKGNFAAVPS